MPMRHLEIPEAYKETYAWIFDERASPFRAWLQNSNGVFWVGGKAGSGKSTLLKYVSDSKRTRNILKHWASGNRLCVVSFYFWNSGYPMQKTQQGLLQSLLFQVLRSCPDLIQEACQNRWSGMENSVQDAWGREEIMDSLEIALSSQMVKTQYCIFIDGLDEFTGDHYSLIRYFDKLATSPSVKVCVSSRPWNVFRSEYESQTNSMLRLEDKTKGDMDVYVKGMLEQDPRFRRLASYDRNARLFAEEIRERADGVFLWVFLVVRSLLRGLSDHDDAATLRRRLRALPPDLKSYFTHMLESVDEIYREQTARSLLVACTTDEPVPVLVYWCLETEMANSDFAVSAAIEPVTRSEYDWKRSKATSAINKWCRDLLEERETRWNPFFQIMLTYKVDFLHRTVKDFLTSEEIVEVLTKRAGAGYNPRLTLCRSWLYISKGLDSREPGDRDTAHTFLGNAMKYACECERHENVTPVEELESVDQVGNALCSSGKRGKHWSGNANFLEYVKKHDLKLYLQRVSSAGSDSRRHRRFLSATRSRDDDAGEGVHVDGGLHRDDSKVRKRDRIRSMFSRSPVPAAPNVEV